MGKFNKSLAFLIIQQLLKTRQGIKLSHHNHQKIRNNEELYKYKKYKVLSGNKTLVNKYVVRQNQATIQIWKDHKTTT